MPVGAVGSRGTGAQAAGHPGVYDMCCQGVWGGICWRAKMKLSEGHVGMWHPVSLPHLRAHGLVPGGRSLPGCDMVTLTSAGYSPSPVTSLKLTMIIRLFYSRLN